MPIVCWLVVFAHAWFAGSGICAEEPKLGEERAVFQTNWGDIEFGFYPEVAPITAQHIFKLVTLGAYTGNHIFRVDKGFVAQVADVSGGRRLSMNNNQQTEGVKTVPLEVKEGVKHVQGVVSMGRYDDPNSGQSSFSFLLGDASHLDMKYTIFGRVTAGMDVLHKLEGLETRKEGIFVMPKERVEIVSSYWYIKDRPFMLGGLPATTAASGGGTGTSGSGSSHSSNSSYCSHVQEELDHLRSRFDWQTQELQRVRQKCLPGT